MLTIYLNLKTHEEIISKIIHNTTHRTLNQAQTRTFVWGETKKRSNKKTPRQTQNGEENGHSTVPRQLMLGKIFGLLL